jgi:hypothetical protein
MKSFPLTSIKVFAAIIACTLLAGTSTRGGSDRSDYRSGTARLVVHRAADFGTVISLNIYIDGVQVTALPQNTGYEALIRPGHHTLAVSTSPCPYGKTRFTYKNVSMHPGETYAYTAIWEYADWAKLETGDKVVDLVRDVGHY